MKIWVLSTCVPNDPEPCWPSVFTSSAAADKAFEDAMRGEWEAAGITEEDSDTKLPFPDDPNDAHDQLKAYHLENSSELWGQWEITPHEIDVTEPVSPIFIPTNQHGVKPGYYTRPDIVRLLRLHKGNPAAVQYIADMME